MDGKSGDRGYSIADSLHSNIDEVVTIYTDGCCCFTGLLCCISCGVVKLVTRNSCGCRHNCYGNLTIIPICEIIAVTFCN